MRCPNCNEVWTIEEMAAECCAACGYPDTDDEDEFDPDELEDQ
jgi:hypothetical protein